MQPVGALRGKRNPNVVKLNEAIALMMNKINDLEKIDIKVAKLNGMYPI